MLSMTLSLSGALSRCVSGSVCVWCVLALCVCVFVCVSLSTSICHAVWLLDTAFWWMDTGCRQFHFFHNEHRVYVLPWCFSSLPAAHLSSGRRKMSFMVPFKALG